MGDLSLTPVPDCRLTKLLKSGYFFSSLNCCLLCFVCALFVFALGFFVCYVVVCVCVCVCARVRVSVY